MAAPAPSVAPGANHIENLADLADVLHNETGFYASKGLVSDDAAYKVRSLISETHNHLNNAREYHGGPGGAAPHSMSEAADSLRRGAKVLLESGHPDGDYSSPVTADSRLLQVAYEGEAGKVAGAYSDAATENGRR
jgi:hypothetical protein